MGTSNFLNLEASSVYIIDEDANIQDIKEMLAEINRKKRKTIEYQRWELPIPYGLESYPATSIGSMEKKMSFLSIELDVILNIQILDGYYEEVNIDFDCMFKIYGKDEYITSLDDVISFVDGSIDFYEDEYYFPSFSEKKWKKEKNNIKEKIKKEQEKLAKELEKVFLNFSTPYCSLMTASNGETIYAKCCA